MKKTRPLATAATDASQVKPAAAAGEPPPALASVVANAFGRLNSKLRARMLSRLLTSVGPLALTVVSGGAFAKYVRYARWSEIPVSIDDAARATSSQVYELARYVQQADPQLFGQVLDVLSHDATTVAYVSASIAALTINRLSRADEGTAALVPELNHAQLALHQIRHHHRQPPVVRKRTQVRGTLEARGDRGHARFLAPGEYGAGIPVRHEQRAVLSRIDAVRVDALVLPFDRDLGTVLQVQEVRRRHAEKRVRPIVADAENRRVVGKLGSGQTQLLPFLGLGVELPYPIDVGDPQAASRYPDTFGLFMVKPAAGRKRSSSIMPSSDALLM